MKIENKFDGVFRQKSKQIKVKPSDEVWLSIEQKISRKNYTYRIAQWVVAAVAIIFIGVFGILSLDRMPVNHSSYQVEQIQIGSDATYDQALMEWVSYARKT